MLAVVLIAIGMTGVQVSAQDATSVATPMADGTSAEAFCAQRGGVVRERTPFYGTNLDRSQWIQTGESRLFCEFQHGAGSDDDSGIQIDLKSFAANGPRLATVAYLAQVPIPDDLAPASANPATSYCAYLGGTQSWGGATSAAGGGWVTDDASTPYEIMDACVFPDGSMISAWGLTYHANGVVRGADLTQLLAWQPVPDEIPAIFPSGE